MDRLTSMAVFVRVVDKGGFSAAAEAFDLSPTMVGKHVRALEQQLGSRLLNRTTRRQRLTEVGKAYYDRCKQLLADVEEMDNVASEARLAPRGLLRVNAPVSFGSMQLVPAIAEYLSHFPEVDIDLTLDDRVVDLVEEGYELAFRIGPLADSNLVARPLAPYRIVVCASPDYLAANGTPKTPRDLANHSCLAFSRSSTAGRDWALLEPRGKLVVPIKGRMRVNSGAALRMAALNGIGIIMQPEELVADDIAAGRLKRLLPKYESASRPMHIVYLPDRHATPKLKSFIDFTIARFGSK